MTFGYVGAVFVVVSLLMAKLATLKINDHAVGGLLEGADTLWWHDRTRRCG